MVKAVRFRHASASERRLGTEMMRPREILYSLEKSEVIDRLTKAMREGHDQIRGNDIASMDFGAIREVTLRQVYTDAELDHAFMKAEPDPEGQRQLLIKSARQLDILANAERVRR